MAITQRVQTQLVHVVVAPTAATTHPPQPSASLRHRQLDSECNASSRIDASAATDARSTTSKQTAWTPAEHERFLQALQLFPAGPWKQIAAVVGTKTARQSMTHAQKCRQKIARRQRGLKLQSRVPAVVSPPLPVAATAVSERLQCNALRNARPAHVASQPFSTLSMRDLRAPLSSDSIAWPPLFRQPPLPLFATMQSQSQSQQFGVDAARIELCTIPSSSAAAWLPHCFDRGTAVAATVHPLKNDLIELFLQQRRDDMNSSSNNAIVSVKHGERKHAPVVE